MPPGGVLIYGIPEFRLPKDIVQAEIDRLKADGVEIEVNAIVGKTWTLSELRTMYDAIFVAVGAGLPVFMDVPGENLKGVYSANEYLTRVNLMGAYREAADTPVLHGHRVAVVGGGNVAMDSVRTSLRLGADEAIIVYRRSREELPARAEEAHHAEQEGVRFEFLAAPVEVLGDDAGWVRALRCVRMELGEPDASGRRRPAPVPGSEFEIPCEMVVVAIGTRSNPLLTASEPDLAVNEWGYLVVDEDGMTSLPGVFAGGDIVRGAATVILAMGDGKRAAGAIERYLVRVAEMAEGTEAAAAGELNRGPDRGASSAAGGRHPVQDRALHAFDRDPLLGHRVAVPERDRAILERVDVHRDAPGRADLVLPPVELADGGRVVVDGHHVPPQVVLDPVAQLHDLGPLLEQRQHRHLVRARGRDGAPARPASRPGPPPRGRHR